MNDILTLNNVSSAVFPLEGILMPKGLEYSSDSFVDESDKISQQIIAERFDVVRSNIGDELFNKLSYDDQILMANTAGIIDFGRPIDLDKIEKEIENYGYSN